MSGYSCGSVGLTSTFHGTSIYNFPYCLTRLAISCTTTGEETHRPRFISPTTGELRFSSRSNRPEGRNHLKQARLVGLIVGDHWRWPCAKKGRSCTTPRFVCSTVDHIDAEKGSVGRKPQSHTQVGALLFCPCVIGCARNEANMAVYSGRIIISIVIGNADYKWQSRSRSRSV